MRNLDKPEEWTNPQLFHVDRIAIRQRGTAEISLEAVAHVLHTRVDLQATSSITTRAPSQHSLPYQMQVALIPRRHWHIAFRPPTRQTRVELAEQPRLGRRTQAADTRELCQQARPELGIVTVELLLQHVSQLHMAESRQIVGLVLPGRRRDEVDLARGEVVLLDQRDPFLDRFLVVARQVHDHVSLELRGRVTGVVLVPQQWEYVAHPDAAGQ